MVAPNDPGVALWQADVSSESRPDGTLVVRQTSPLPSYPTKITERLVHFAQTAGERTWMAQRGADGSWRHVTYAEALQTARRIGTGLLKLGLSADRPILILSGNSLEHALLVLGAYYVGIPFAAISPAYSLVSTDHAKLKDIAVTMTPGLVFADDGARFHAAIAASFDTGVPVLSVRNVAAERGIAFASLAATTAEAEADAAHEAISPDTIAKFLFTSGSTGSPKPVIQTQRLMCSNQAMVLDCYAFMAKTPPVVVDWAPWNHTASGNKVFNLVLYNGGSYYIDEGKPSPAGIAETIRNLREIAPTWYFNVPAGYEMLVAAMETDTRLRERFFSRVQMLMYAGAGMAQHTWDALQRLAVATVGHRVLLATGLGSTETGPFALMCTEFQDKAGNVGIPAKGIELKLVPQDGRLEARIKGPNVTPGYWRNPALTAEAFDEEGFYRLGDALRLADPQNPAAGFYFDGRLAENFKLDTGTWVAVGALRARLVDALNGLVRDAVIAGENRPEIGALLVPALDVIRARLPQHANLDDAALLRSEALTALLAPRLEAFAHSSSGSAGRVSRALVLADPLSLDRGEVTDKGSINQRAVLRNRPDLVAALYDDATPQLWRLPQRTASAA